MTPLARLLPLVLAVAACRSASVVAPPPQTKPASVPVANDALDLGFDPTAIDVAASPCQDFYQFACGAWLARTPIPRDRSSWSRSFSVILERNQNLLHTILDAYAAGHVNLGEPDAHRVGDFYASCMDEEAVARAGQEALTAWLARIQAVSSLDDLATLARWMHDSGFNVFFTFGPDQDFRDATRMIGEADQGGLGLPDRDYYLKQDPSSKKLRDAYRAHVARMLVLAGESEATAAVNAEAVMDIETRLAQASMSLVMRRDPRNVYHLLDRVGLDNVAPRFPWARYFVGDLTNVTVINVAVPDFFAGLNRVLVDVSLAKLRAYLLWHAVSDHAMALGPRFVDESFAFSRLLTGAEVLLPRWKRCEEAADGALGEALAQPFVKQAFSADSKQRALTMVRAIEEAFARDLKDISWMDAPTRAAAQDKLHAIYDKIGYPQTWRRYDEVAIDRTSYIDNVLAATAFESARQHAKIGKAVDKKEWSMTPVTVNAYYNPQLNEMVFPAGILQAPFFALAAPAAANYGAIGMVMGHELTHGFDDTGRKFDKDGNLRDWWTAESARAYEAKTACVVRQYSSYHAYDDVPVNGSLTLGENIADLGGAALALDAFRHREGAHAGSVAGYTDEQRFFLGLAQAWCTNRRPELDRSLALVDPHAPPRLRVNGALSDLPDFASAFACKSGLAMAPADRCTVW